MANDNGVQLDYKKHKFPDDNKVRVGEKNNYVYVNAVMFKMDRYQDIQVTGFGSRVNKAIAIGEICSRKLRVTNDGIIPVEEMFGDKKVHGVVIKLKREVKE